jgi:hypothetical protein
MSKEDRAAVQALIAADQETGKIAFLFSSIVCGNIYSSAASLSRPHLTKDPVCTQLHVCC